MDQTSPGRRRRVHSAEFKSQAVEASQQPGVSMAAVAMAHGINANLLRRWVHETESRSDQHPRTFLGHGTECGWKGSLVCDDYAGYKALFLDGGIKEAGCMAHARRKFVELHLTNKSTLAATAIEFIGQLYGIEREVKAAEDRLRERQTRAAPVAQVADQAMGHGAQELTVRWDAARRAAGGGRRAAGGGHHEPHPDGEAQRA